MKPKRANLSQNHEAWATLAAQSHRLVDNAFKTETLLFARNMMRPVRAILLELIDGLLKDGYEFAPDITPYSEPVQGVAEALERFWQRGVYVPLSVQAWMLEVGSVNLCGNNAKWQRLTYALDHGSAKKVVCTDPLVFEITPEYIEYRLEEHLQQFADGRPEPLELDIAPDHLHKANISGGAPYAVHIDRPQVEALLLNERHCTTFTEYVRRAISWQGFPGMDYVEPGLLPISVKSYPPF